MANILDDYLKQNKRADYRKRNEIDPRLIERSNKTTSLSRASDQTKPIFTPGSTIPPDDMEQVVDSSWVKQAFLVDDASLAEATDVENRYWTSANTKFTDTRIGGNIGINARPQFTRYSDIRAPGRLKTRREVSLNNIGGNYGMGRYYSEAIDDNAQTIYLRFGVPQFNSLTSFFSKAFDPNMSSLARTGRASSALYKLGKLAGTFVAVSTFPVLSATILTGRFISMFFTRQTSKFYTLKPTMELYWSAVNTLVNSIAINKGIMPRWYDQAGITSNTKDQQIGAPARLDNKYLDNLHALMPDLFTQNYGIDVFAIASKSQRMYNHQQRDFYDKYDNASETDFKGVVKKMHTEEVVKPEGKHTFAEWIEQAFKFKYIFEGGGKDARTELNPKFNSQNGQGADATAKESWWGYLDAEFNQGSQFAIFKVDHTGAVSEAFSNTATESDISQKLNGISSQVKEARFSFAEGNFGDDVISKMIGGALSGVADVVSGALSGVTMGFSDILQGLAGSGFIDIPKHWQSSSVSLPRSTYTMQLISPYGNPISQIQNIFIPLAMIMAGAMPRSTGSQSYTSPFICQLYDRGRNQIQLGMIESLSITRGTCNLPFNNRGSVLAIDVSFTVADLSSIMHMPLSSGSIFDHDSTLDEDNILMDYLAVLAGQDLYSQIYTLQKAKLALAKRFRSMEKLVSPAFWAMTVHESTTTGAMSYIIPGGIWEAIVKGSANIPNDR